MPVDGDPFLRALLPEEDLPLAGHVQEAVHIAGPVEQVHLPTVIDEGEVEQVARRHHRHLAEVRVLPIPVAAGPARHGRVPQHSDDACEAQLHGVRAVGLVQQVPPRDEAARTAGNLVQPDRRVGEEGVRRVVEALPQHAGGRDASQDEVPGVQEQGHGGAGSRRHVGIYPFIFD